MRDVSSAAVETGKRVARYPSNARRVVEWSGSNRLFLNLVWAMISPSSVTSGSRMASASETRMPVAAINPNIVA